MKQSKKGLGRGLSALIPMEDMEFLSHVARGDFSVNVITPTSEKTAAETMLARKAEGKSRDESPKKSVSLHTKARKQSSARFKGQIEPPIPEGQKFQTHEQATMTTASAHIATRPKLTDISGAPEPFAKLQGSEIANQSLASESSDSVGIMVQNSVVWLAPSFIIANPFQPRRHFDAQELSNLAASIKEHGILQPIIVRPMPDIDDNTDTEGKGKHRFQLVAGERRWRAAQEAGLQVIPAIVREVNDQQALELAVIENVQRHDISPLDAALAYRRLSTEFQLSQERIAVRVGKSRSAVANTLRLLDLPTEVQQSLHEGLLSEGHGRAVLLAEGEGARRAAFRRILRDKLSVREAEELARKLNHHDFQAHITVQPEERTEQEAAIDINAQSLCEELQSLLGTRLSIKHRRRGGQMVIQYSSAEELDRIVALLRNARP